MSRSTAPLQHQTPVPLTVSSWDEGLCDNTSTWQHQPCVVSIALSRLNPLIVTGSRHRASRARTGSKFSSGVPCRLDFVIPPSSSSNCNRNVGTSLKKLTLLLKAPLHSWKQQIYYIYIYIYFIYECRLVSLLMANLGRYVYPDTFTSMLR